MKITVIKNFNGLIRKRGTLEGVNYRKGSELQEIMGMSLPMTLNTRRS